jgi:hypothetical protein
MLKVKCEYCKFYDGDELDLCKRCRTGMYVKDANEETYFTWNNELRRLLEQVGPEFLRRTDKQSVTVPSRKRWTTEDTKYLVRMCESNVDEYRGRYVDICTKVGLELDKPLNSVTNRLRTIIKSGEYRLIVKQLKKEGKHANA